MKEVHLTRGMVALVDDEDYENINKNKWYAASGENKKFRAARSSFGLCIYMHREITGCKSGMVVDHIDGNSLNNQKSNLRICTNSQNMMNRGKQVDNTSGYKGVTFCKRLSKYCAYIKVLKKTIYLGTFNTSESAARAYDAAARKYHGQFSKTNFD